MANLDMEKLMIQFQSDIMFKTVQKGLQRSRRNSLMASIVRDQWLREDCLTLFDGSLSMPLMWQVRHPFPALGLLSSYPLSF